MENQNHTGLLGNFISMDMSIEGVNQLSKSVLEYFGVLNEVDLISYQQYLNQ